MNLSTKAQMELLDLIAYGAIFSIPIEYYTPDDAIIPIAQRLQLQVPILYTPAQQYLTEFQKRVERWRRENL